MSRANINNSSGNNNKIIIVVFTSSLESTHRLARLLQLLWKSARYNNDGSNKNNTYYGTVAKYSSALNQIQQTALIKRCNDSDDNSISVVVYSDGISRGMNLEHVNCVINYNIPVFPKTYVQKEEQLARENQERI